MATFFRTTREDVQVSEATAARATVYFEVNTHEAQVVTVSKAGGAFGATAGSTATQVVGTCYKLTIHASDIDTLGDVAFLSTGATDVHYIMGIRVVTHDPFADLAAILADTGTDGVKIGVGAIVAASFAADAIVAATLATGALTADAFAADAIIAATLATGVITADAFAADAIVAATLATDALGSDALAATALTEIATAVMTALVATHKSTSGSLADTLNDIWRRLGYGLRVYDSSAGTIKSYDGGADTDTLLLTETRSAAGSKVNWTPS